MTEYEKIAKLMEKASVSEDEARAALEENDWDLLDAILSLERDGKVAGSTAQHSTRTEEAAPEPEPEPRSRFSERTVSFREQVRKIIAIGNRNHFIVQHNGKQVLSMPLTVLVILVLCLNAWGLIALAVGLFFGLFFGLKYSITGTELGKPAVNDVMNKVANAAENVRETVEDSFRKEK